MIGTAGWYGDPKNPGRFVYFNGSYAEDEAEPVSKLMAWVTAFGTAIAEGALLLIPPDPNDVSRPTGTA